MSVKVALIGPAFFGYLPRIAGLLSARGTPAQFFDERLSNSIGAKVFFRFAARAAKERAARAHCLAIAEAIVAQGFTHALLVSPEIFTPEAVGRLRAAGVTVCRYGWDSVANKPHMKQLDPLMAAIASFDPADCATYGYQLIPLYSDITPPAQAVPRDTDVFYCATLHSRRPQFIRAVIALCRQRGWSTQLMLFYHARWLWLLRYGWNPRLWSLLRLVSDKPFSQAQIMQATCAARVVLDIHHHGQSGLTMRTFEALSLGAVVLTTNAAALQGLLPALQERIVLCRQETLADDLAKALQRSPGALSDATRYFLSVGRFLDQLQAFMFADAAAKTGDDGPANITRKSG
jgi:hypothetical protein